MDNYRPDINAPSYAYPAQPESETGSMVGMPETLPATPDNSVVTGINAGSLEVPSGQTIEAEQPCNITNPGVE